MTGSRTDSFFFEDNSHETCGFRFLGTPPPSSSSSDDDDEYSLPRFLVLPSLPPPLTIIIGGSCACCCCWLKRDCCNSSNSRSCSSICPPRPQQSQHGPVKQSHRIMSIIFPPKTLNKQYSATRASQTTAKITARVNDSIGARFLVSFSTCGWYCCGYLC